LSMTLSSISTAKRRALVELIAHPLRSAVGHTRMV
jgi:hypothetical protein